MQLIYDIRGKYPSEINKNLSSFLAKKFIIFLKKKKINKIIIAQDIRKSSIILVNSFAQEILKSKIKIKYLGILPTALFYYYCLKLKTPGVIITASHLPLSYNGFKFFIPPNKNWLYKKIPQSISEQKIQKNIFTTKIDRNLYLNYLKVIKKIIKLKKNYNYSYKENLKSSNKSLLQLLPLVFKELKIKKNSDVFVSSDYDGDRLFIKYRNFIISPEHILFVILKNNNYKKVGIPITIHKKIKFLFPKIKFYFIKTGHSNFKKAYKKYNLDFALEPSYHFYFFKDIKTEAPILALLNLFKFLDNYDINYLKNLKFPLKRIETKNIKIIKKLENYAKINNFKIKKFDDYFYYKKFNNNNYLSFNIRKSKTEKNIYRIFIESSEDILIKKLLNQVF
ncbi:MAG: hypothetical protein KatS3mg095_0796 [Candidatus Parcubacteria bacterium]|nr:MAG: hypothetical protein KatS3mg095_0796 [Candidatus Parcubacteria bacterium]